jgi:hypothetical protein
MLAHQVFDRADFLFVVVMLFGGPNDLMAGSRQHEPRASGDDQTAARIVKFDHLRLLL